MKKISYGYWFILALFLAVGYLSWRVYFKSYFQSDSISIHHFPRTIEGWVSKEVPISDDEKALLETDNVFVRQYTNDQGDEVFLFIVYSQNNRKVSHPPEICYTGGGATILNSVRDTIPAQDAGPGVEVHRLRVERGDVTQIFAYWFKVGNTFTSSYWKQQALIAYNSFLNRPSSSALIRISSTVHNGDYEGAIRLIKQFGTLIMPLVQEYLP